MSVTVVADGGGSDCQLEAFANHGRLCAKTEDGSATCHWAKSKPGNLSTYIVGGAG